MKPAIVALLFLIALAAYAVYTIQGAKITDGEKLQYEALENKKAVAERQPVEMDMFMNGPQDISEAEKAAKSVDPSAKKKAKDARESNDDTLLTATTGAREAMPPLASNQQAILNPQLLNLAQKARSALGSLNPKDAQGFDTPPLVQEYVPHQQIIPPHKTPEMANPSLTPAGTAINRMPSVRENIRDESPVNPIIGQEYEVQYNME